MIRDIFVPLLRGPGDSAALDAALALARDHRAHVAALATVETPMPLATEWGYVPAEINQQMLQEATVAAEALAAQARERLGREAVSSEVRLTASALIWSEETAALQARHADLVVLGGHERGQTSHRFALNFKALLFNSGRPVLLMPAGTSLVAPVKRAVLAWQPTAEASRALHDALPLLAPGATVDVLMVDPQVAEGRHGEQPGADIAAHLARHDYAVNVVALPRQGKSVAEILVAYPAEVGAGLLVMGGYGHSRWREAVLGGTTRSVLETAAGPVLFAH